MSNSNDNDLLSELLWSDIKPVILENIPNFKDINSIEEYHNLFTVLNRFYKISAKHQYFYKYGTFFNII